MTAGELFVKHVCANCSAKSFCNAPDDRCIAGESFFKDLQTYSDQDHLARCEDCEERTRKPQ